MQGKQTTSGQGNENPAILVLHELNDNTWRRQYAGICRYAEARGLDVKCVLVDGSQTAAVERAIKREVPVGIIASLGAKLPKCSRLPVVYFDCPLDLVERNMPYVCHDSEFTAHIVALELFKLKYSNYAFVGCRNASDGKIPQWSTSRAASFAAEVGKKKCAKLAAPFVPKAKRDRAGVEEDLKAYLAVLPKPCGVFAANDAVAVMVRDIAKQANIRVPEDIAIVGVDDDKDLCTSSRPTISSVIPDWEGGGWVAAAALGSLLDGSARENVQQTFRPLGLIRRESTTRFGTRVDVRVEQAVTLIRAKACSGLTSSDVIATMRSSRRFAELLFRDVTGASILEEIRRVRFEKAKLMLSHTGLPTKVICKRCGYASLPTFCREFQRIVGVTPAFWRDRERSLSRA